LGIGFIRCRGVKTPLEMKALARFGRGVFELRESYDRNAYRVVYIANLRKAIYVLHAFMKKSKSGIGLSRKDAALDAVIL
jgi:phage-related protein